MRILAVVPFLNEAEHLPELLESMAAQERLPDRLVLVDDGSHDASPEQAAAFVADHSWATLLRRPPRPPERDRLVGAQELRAFQWGLDQVDEPWDVAAKIDADLRLTPATLATLMAAFDADPKLGMAGAYIRAPDENGRLVRQRCPSDHVEGETKLYRRECFEDIAPLPPILGWETIDEFRARLRGWRTASFEVPGGDPVHLRTMGSRDGELRGYRRRGASAWGYGEHPLHVLAMGIQRLGDRPRVLGGVSYVAGYLLAAIRRRPRAEPEVRAEARRYTLHKLGARLVCQRRDPVVRGSA